MNVQEWEQWLCGEQWAGFPLEQIRPLQDIHLPALRSLAILIGGLGGETGEALEHFKKLIRDGQFDKYKAGLELGDALAYLTWLAHVAGYTLDDIVYLNHVKLTARGKKEAS